MTAMGSSPFEPIPGNAANNSGRIDAAVVITVIIISANGPPARLPAPQGDSFHSFLHPESPCRTACDAKPNAGAAFCCLASSRSDRSAIFRLCDLQTREFRIARIHTHTHTHTHTHICIFGNIFVEIIMPGKVYKCRIVVQYISVFATLRVCYSKVFNYGTLV